MLLGYFLSLIAPLFYFFDLFSHFAIQYVIAGFVLGSILAFYKRWGWTSLNIIIAILCLIESRANLEYPYQFTAPKKTSTFTIASFNHNFATTSYSEIENWVKSNSDNFDMIVFIEATLETKRMSERLHEYYPYYINEDTDKPFQRPFSYIILSKTEIIKTRAILLSETPWTNVAVNLQIKPTDFSETISIYSLHPHPPVNKFFTDYRDEELNQVSQIISDDDTKNIIAIGDFNVSPYSPSFNNFLKTSNLNFQSYGFLLNPTWPAQFPLPIFQIPIDHVLYSDNLIQQNKYVGPAIFSDHHAIIAEFSEKP